MIILLALLIGTITAWMWTSFGTTTLEALKAGGGAGAFTFGAGITTFYFFS